MTEVVHAGRVTFTLPKLSLGWVVAPFIERHLGITLTNEQTIRLFEYYRVDERGLRVVRRAAVLRPKGLGKSPEGGYLAFVELCGPVEFAGWEKNGRPMGKPKTSPLVQIAAVAEDQTANVMQWLIEALEDRTSTIAELGLNVSTHQITTRRRNGVGKPGKIEVVSSAADSKEGARASFVVIDQSEALTKSNGGVALVATMRRNVGKRAGWSIELMNAPELGDGSVADKTMQAVDKGSAGIYFDRGPEAPEVPDLSDMDALVPALYVVYGEAALIRDDDGDVVSGWVDVERLAAEINDPDTDPADARRFYLNQSVPKSARAFDRKQFIANGKGRSPLKKDEFVVAGFDGSLFDDSTALVLMGIESGTIELGGLWEKPSGDGWDDWQVDVDEVDLRVEELNEEFEIWRLYADPFRWQSSMSRWAGLRRREWVASWHTGRWKPIGYACRNFATEIRSGEIGPSPVEEGDPNDLLRHVSNAVRRQVNVRDEQNRQLWTLAKPAPSLKIDACMAAVLAAECRRDAIAAKAKPRRRRIKSAGF